MNMNDEELMFCRNYAKAHILALRPDWLEDGIRITKLYFDNRKPASHIFIRFEYRGEKYKYTSGPILVWDLD
jgi:hypothetical protein